MPDLNRATPLPLLCFTFRLNLSPQLTLAKHHLRWRWKVNKTQDSWLLTFLGIST